MKKTVCLILYIAFITLFCGCSTDVIDILMPSTHTCHLQFNGGFSNYEDEPTTRAAVSVQNGAVMYLLFRGNVTGRATFDNGSWTLTYDGTIKEGACSAYYFPEVSSETSTIVTFKKNIPIYGTKEGVCSIASNGDITVNAQLKPMCPRVRFKGDANTTVTCNGSYQTYSSYTISTGILDSNSESINTMSIGSNGYSDYYYYTSMPSTMTIAIDGTSYSAAIPFPTSPKSICLNLPTTSNLNGWAKEEGGTEGGNMHNGHGYVDLGLPSGVKWATCNVGASSPEEYGDYFAWGETEPKSDYFWSTYKWCEGSSSTMTKYCTSSSYGKVDNKTVLDPEDDAAHVNLGGEWRMPTKEEQDELRTKCTWTWGSQNGINGYTVVGPNGNSLFLPAAGCHIHKNLNDVGEYGGYWSSSLISDDSSYAYEIYFYSSLVDSRNNQRLYGQSIRPVWSESIKISTISLSESSLTLKVGETHTLLPTVSPSYATNQSLTWSSSNTSVATVTQSGQVTAMKSGTTTITATSNDGSGVKATCYVTVSAHVHNGHEYVDLGLPSGTKWADVNVGATSDNIHGKFFTWGELVDQISYYRYNYIYYNTYGNGNTFYDIGLEIAGNVDYDVAAKEWGGKWRMPTYEQVNELVENCTFEYSFQSGSSGYKITGPNMNNIFIPASGYKYDDEHYGLYDGVATIWSSTLYQFAVGLHPTDKDWAYMMIIYSDARAVVMGDYRYFGRPVRPVYK